MNWRHFASTSPDEYTFVRWVSGETASIGRGERGRQGRERAKDGEAGTPARDRGEGPRGAPRHGTREGGQPASERPAGQRRGRGGGRTPAFAARQQEGVRSARG